MIEDFFNKIAETLGPTIFGALGASLSEIVSRRLPFFEALTAAVSALFLALVFTAPISELVRRWTDMSDENSQILVSGVIVLIGRAGIVGILNTLLHRWGKK